MLSIRADPRAATFLGALVANRSIEAMIGTATGTEVERAAAFPTAVDARAGRITAAFTAALAGATAVGTACQIVGFTVVRTVALASEEQGQRHPSRLSTLWDDPDCLLRDHPIRRRAARTTRALREGHWLMMRWQTLL